MSYVPPEEQETKITITGMYSQLAVNTAIGVGTLIIFGFLRPRNGIVYAPKQKYSSEKKQPPKIENQGLFSWIKPVISSPEELLIEKIGLDAVMFLKFIRMCRNMFLWLFFLGLVIAGVNVFGTRQDRKQFPKTDNPLQYLSISYLRNSRWFWIHVAFTWIFSLIIFRFLYKQYKEYSILKKQYFRSEEYQSSLHSRTILITGVPPNMQSDEGLQKYIMQNLKVNNQQISQAHISRKVGRLPELIEEHDKVVRELESVLARYLKDPNKISSKRPKHSLGGGCGGEKVDSIDYYTSQIQSLEAEINSERERIKERKAINYGFVSFTNIADAHLVAKKHEGKVSLHEPQILLAPWPKDIIWNNITMTNAVRGTKRLIGYAFFLLLCFFWLIPISLLSTAAQIQNIVKIAPFTEDIFYANDFIAGFIESWMSPLIMGTFFLILPQILRIISRHQGKITKSSLDRAVLGKLYLFFLINNIIIYTLSSTLLDLYGKIRATIDSGDTNFKDFYKVIKEADFFDELADSLIKVSSFWINYISLRGVGAIFDLAQIISLIIINVKKLFVQPTPRNIKEFSRPPDFDYPVYYNIHLFFFTVGMLYSVIAPLILFFCFTYFSLALLVYRYQLMYVFTTKIETGGTFWRVVFNRLIASLLFWQVIMITVMNLKGAHIQSVALLPLPAITLLVKFICAKRFDSPIRYYKRNKSDPENNNMISNNINDKISNRFGHPVLTTELITPMVHSNVKHLLSKVYSGRIDESKVSRRGTIKSMSMIVGKNNQSFNIQTVDQNELEWDEQAYYEEQKPGYYVDHSDTVSNYSGTTIMSSNNVPQMNQNHYQQRNIHPNNNSSRLPPPNSPNNPNNNVYPRQQRPRYQYDNNSSSSLLRQDSADNYSNYSDDASSLYRQQQQYNYNNSAPRGGYTPPPPPPPLTPTQQYNQRGYNQNNYNQNNYNNNNYHQNNYNQNNYNQNNYNQNTYNQDNYNNQHNYNYNHQNYNNQNDRGYNNNNSRGY